MSVNESPNVNQNNVNQTQSDAEYRTLLLDAAAFDQLLNKLPDEETKDAFRDIAVRIRPQGPDVPSFLAILVAPRYLSEENQEIIIDHLAQVRAAAVAGTRTSQVGDVSNNPPGGAHFKAETNTRSRGI